MNELGLELLKPRLGALSFRQVANEACEVSPVARFHLADGELYRKRRSVLALAHNDAADADDAPLARTVIAFEITVMALPIRRRHQYLDVAADDFVGLVAEQALCRRAKGVHGPGFVDDDHRVRYGFQNGCEMRFTRKQTLLGQLKVGNVVVDDGDNGLFRVTPQRPFGRDRAALPVAAIVDNFTGPFTAICQLLLDVGERAWKFRTQQLVRGLSDGLMARIAIKALHPPSPEADRAVPTANHRRGMLEPAEILAQLLD